MANEPPKKPPVSSISHSALSIQKEIAFEDGKANLHLKLSTLIQNMRSEGQTQITLDHLERMLSLYMASG
jgi:hypothetical protein